jgi:hypothetical protein
MTEYITKEQAENILAKLNGMRDAQRDPNGAVVYTPEGVRKAINLAFEQRLEARSWGVFEKIDGEWSLQFPLFGSQHMAKESLKDYADDVLMEVRPLYALKGDSK